MVRRILFISWELLSRALPLFQGQSAGHITPPVHPHAHVLDTSNCSRMVFTTLVMKTSTRFPSMKSPPSGPSSSLTASLAGSGPTCERCTGAQKCRSTRNSSFEMYPSLLKSEIRNAVSVLRRWFFTRKEFTPMDRYGSISANVSRESPEESRAVKSVANWLQSMCMLELVCVRSEASTSGSMRGYPVLHTQWRQQRASFLIHDRGYCAVRVDATVPGVSRYHRDGAVNFSSSAAEAEHWNASCGVSGVGQVMLARAAPAAAVQTSQNNALLLHCADLLEGATPPSSPFPHAACGRASP
mmetsp:Transcript_25831/g.61638  ORF Transcript_25831/g.61638 Transcript_25831/m.61638 type:complete len:299 (-) Transcript_25831:18-914(-)